MRTQNPLVATPCGFKSHRRHHVGMDFAPFKKPSRLAGLFSYRSVIPPSPHETLLRKFSWGPRPPCRAANVQAVYRLRRLFCKSHRRAHFAAAPSPRETLLRKFSQGPWPPCRAAAHCAPFRKPGRLAGLSLSFSFRSGTPLAARAFPGENAHGSTVLLAHLCRHSQLRGAVFV